MTNYLEKVVNEWYTDEKISLHPFVIYIFLVNKSLLLS